MTEYDGKNFLELFQNINWDMSSKLDIQLILNMVEEALSINQKGANVNIFFGGEIVSNVNDSGQLYPIGEKAWLLINGDIDETNLNNDLVFARPLIEMAAIIYHQQLELNNLREENYLLEESHEQLRALLELSGTGISIVTRDKEKNEWISKYFNPGLIKIFGYDPNNYEDVQEFQRIQNSPNGMFEFLIDKDRERIALANSEISETLGEPKIYGIHPRMNTQEIRYIQTQSCKVKEGKLNQERITYVASVVDITDIIKTSHKNEIAKYFLRSIIHSINNAQQIIQTKSEMYRVYPDRITPEGLEIVSRKNMQIAALVDQVKEVMELVVDGEGELVKSSSNIMPYIEIIQQNFQNELMMRDINLQVDTESLGKNSIYVNWELTKLVIEELVGNSVKYSKNNGFINIYTEETPIEDCTLLVIEGNGVPALPDERGSYEWMFESNKRGANVEDIYGTGQGLFLSKKLLEFMSANIRFEQEVISTWEDGSPKEVIKKFKIDFPNVK